MQKSFLSGLFAIVLTFIATSATAETSCEDVDFNENGVVDESDIEIVKTSLGKSVGEEGYLAAADLDESGSITPIDFGMLLSCR